VGATDTEQRFYTLSEVARLLEVSEQSVRRWIKAGELVAYKPKKEYRIAETDLRQFLEGRRAVPLAQAPPSQRTLFNGVIEERHAQQAGQAEQAARALNTSWLRDVERDEFTVEEYDEAGHALYALDALLADAMTDRFIRDEPEVSEAYRTALNRAWQAVYDLQNTLQRAREALEARGVTDLTEYRKLRAAKRVPTDAKRSRGTA
jgi:excisionase family DNA binding protein